MDYNTQKIVAVIPAYEPSFLFVKYAEELLKSIPHLVVINDGSGEKYDEIFDELSKMGGCSVISYADNRGKGYALCRGFEYLKENFNDEYVFVTADCDGQHLISDLLKVAKSAFSDKSALHLGSRDFDDPSVPQRSRRGNLTTRRLFDFLYGLKLDDTQTGLRAFSYSLLPELLKIKGNRFEYEMNMLVRFKKLEIPIKETPITTVYEEKPHDVEKVSHFRTLQDSFRVMAILFKNLGWYFLSSVLSALLDVAAFYFLSSFVFHGENEAIDSLLATVIARATSSILNFTLNYKFVFGGKGKLEIFKYYILWFFQLGFSYLFAFVLNSLIASKILVTLLKGVLDLCVALASYKIQQKWVFS